MQNHDDLIPAFIHTEHTDTDPVLMALLLHAKNLGFVSEDEKRRLLPLLRAARDYTLAQAVEELRDERETDRKVIADRLHAQISPRSVHTFFVLTNRGIPVSDSPRLLFRAWGISRRPARPPSP